MLPESLKPYSEYIFIGAFLLVLAIGGFVYYDMNRPSYGSWRFGICKTYAELDTRYPHTIEVTQVVEDRTYAEIYVSFLNAHGMRPTRVYKCNYEQTDRGIRLKEVYVDFDRQSDEKVNKFNQTIPFLMNNPDIDVTLPNWEGMSVEALRRN